MVKEMRDPYSQCLHFWKASMITSSSWFTILRVFMCGMKLNYGLCLIGVQNLCNFSSAKDMSTKKFTVAGLLVELSHFSVLRRRFFGRTPADILVSFVSVHKQQSIKKLEVSHY